MIPVLIVGYLRPENIAKILDSINPERSIYVFIDHSAIDPVKNEQVHLTALSFGETRSLTVHKTDSNLGVGKAIPAAISWVFEREECVIVLEDDCIPNEFMFEYFEKNITLLNSENIILSARAPYVAPQNVMNKNGKSSYPLTNAWAIRKEEWNHFLDSSNSRFPLAEFLKGLLLNPRNFLSLNYFFAATIRARNGLLKAWDVEMSLYFLSHGKKCLLPNHSCVTILGVDAVASNTRAGGKNTSEVYLAASRLSPSSDWDFSKIFQLKIDGQIARNIYGIRVRHIFSPLKSVVILLAKAIHTKK
jgi:hypothetical protein